MPGLLYIHGFLSSPLSFKAQQMQQWLIENRPDIRYHCPALTPYPGECYEMLNTIVESYKAKQEPLYLMGSSMGGFWASYFTERDGLPAVLINPAVNPMEIMPNYLGQSLNNYHTDAIYELKVDDLEALSRYDTPKITRHNCYWLLVQTADETLDYRLAVDKYQGCKQTVEQGGDHSFQGFDRFHAESIDFFEGYYEE